jgi:hypothetical protein
VFVRRDRRRQPGQTIEQVEVSGQAMSMVSMNCRSGSFAGRGKLPIEIEPHEPRNFAVGSRPLITVARRGFPAWSAALDVWLFIHRHAAQGTLAVPKDFMLLAQVQNLLHHRNGKPVGIDTIDCSVRQGVRGATGGMVKLHARRLGGRTYSSQARLEAFIRGCTAPIEMDVPGRHGARRDFQRRLITRGIYVLEATNNSSACHNWTFAANQL